MDTDIFIAHVETDDIYEDIAKDVEKKFDTANYELERPLPKPKNKKVIGIMKDEFGGKILKEFVGLRAKIYSYLTDDNDESKKEKVQEMCNKKKV